MSRNPTPLIEKRRQEILDAFLKLFCTRRFNEIHIKMISEETSFTRATIYNYFKNIDEIFVSAYQKEYVAWAEDLGLILSGHQQLTHEELARLIAESLSHRELMLRFSLKTSASGKRTAAANSSSITRPPSAASSTSCMTS